MTKRKITKKQTMIYKTLHRKLKVDHHEPIRNGIEENYVLRKDRAYFTSGKQRFVINGLSFRFISIEVYFVMNRDVLNGYQ